MGSYWPVRCYTCGKVLGHMHCIYTENINDETTSLQDIMNKMKLRRYCCRRMVMGYVDFEENVKKDRDSICVDNFDESFKKMTIKE